jgi:hypothetical protein
MAVRCNPFAKDCARPSATRETSRTNRSKPRRTQHETTKSSCPSGPLQWSLSRGWRGPAFRLPLVQKGCVRCRRIGLWSRMCGKLGHCVPAVHRRYGWWLRRLRIGRFYQMSPAGGDSVPSGAPTTIADNPASALRRSDDHENADPIQTGQSRCEHGSREGRRHAVGRVQYLHGRMRPLKRLGKDGLPVALPGHSLLIEAISRVGRKGYIRPALLLSQSTNRRKR